MDVDEFLRARAIDLPAVLSAASAALPLEPGDVLLLCGSVAEGLANDGSDLDLELITSRGVAPREAVLLRVGNTAVDIRIEPRRDVETLLQRFDRWSRERPTDRFSAAAFSDADRKLLHRLSSGRLLHGVRDFEVRPRELARLRLVTARYGAHTAQGDLGGWRGAGDLHSMVFTAQHLLDHAADALLAGHGVTNPSWKWRLRFLGQLPSGWERELPGRPSGVAARDRYMSLHRAPEAINAQSVFEHAHRIAAFARRVLAWADWRLCEEGPTPFRAIESNGDRPPFPRLDFEVVARYRDGYFEVMRLNGNGQVFRLLPEELSILSRFDGETPRHDGEEADRMMALVRHAGLEARGIIDEEALRAILRPR